MSNPVWGSSISMAPAWSDEQTPRGTQVPGEGGPLGAALAQVPPPRVPPTGFEAQKPHRMIRCGADKGLA